MKLKYSGVSKKMKQSIGIYKSILIVLTKVTEWLKFYVLQQTQYKINLIISISPLIQVHWTVMLKIKNIKWYFSPSG